MPRVSARSGQRVHGQLHALRLRHDVDGTSRLRDAKGKTVLHGNFVSGFSSHTVVPEGGLVPIKKDVPLDWACLMSCCIPTGWSSVTKLAGVLPGDKVAVWGLGGVGQNVLRAAKMRQANPLIAVDLEESRRSVATELGRHSLHL